MAQSGHHVKLCRLILDCLGDHKIFKMPETWDTCHKKLLTQCGTSPSERNVLHSTKLNGVEDMKSALIICIEMQNSEFAQLVFSLTLIPYFFILHSFLPLE